MNLSHLKGPDTSSRPKRFQSVGECLQHYAAELDDRESVVFRSSTDPRCAVTWRELCDKSYKMARAFVHLGVKPGECIAIVTRTCPEWLYVNFGAVLAGARVTTIVFTYKDGSDVIKLFEKIGNCSLIVLDPGIEESNWNILKILLDDHTKYGKVTSSKLPYLRHLVFIQSPGNEDVTTVYQLLDQDHTAIELPEVDPDEICIIFQTSGSTGIPELVAHTYQTLTGMADLVQDDSIVREVVNYNDRPFGWLGGFPSSVFLGQKRITMSGFCPEPADKVAFLIGVIQEEKVMTAALFPQMLSELVLRYKELPSDWPLYAVLYGGQPVTKSATSCIGRICKAICMGYGGTEFLFGTIQVVDNPDTYADYFCGTPMPGVEMKVVQTDGEIAPCGERGRLHVRSPSIFKEYLNNPEKTASVKTPDGWFITDDVGRIDSNTGLYIEGRMSEMIISGGINVSPAALESTLKTFPGVHSAFIVPVPDVTLYQVVCACVCVEKGRDVTEAKLRDFMEGAHNDKKQLTVLPKYYLILDELPEEWNGKTSRKTLRKMAEEKFKN